jgi:nitroreductase
MKLKELLLKNRSCRRFDQSIPVSMKRLEYLVGLARLSASAANLQPLKYVLSNESRTNSIIFEHITWAAYLKGWPGPSQGERPPAYIVILGDHTITDNFHCDHGIAAQNILLGAVEKKMAGCILGSMNPKLSHGLGLPGHLEPLLVLALGTPAETSEIESVDESGNVRYFRDTAGVMHVPKRELEELVWSRNPLRVIRFEEKWPMAASCESGYLL